MEGHVAQVSWKRDTKLNFCLGERICSFATGQEGAHKATQKLNLPGSLNNHPKFSKIMASLTGPQQEQLTTTYYKYHPIYN